MSSVRRISVETGSPARHKGVGRSSECVSHGWQSPRLDPQTPCISIWIHHSSCEHRETFRSCRAETGALPLTFPVPVDAPGTRCHRRVQRDASVRMPPARSGCAGGQARCCACRSSGWPHRRYLIACPGAGALLHASVVSRGRQSHRAARAHRRYRQVRADGCPARSNRSAEQPCQRSRAT